VGSNSGVDRVDRDDGMIISDNGINGDDGINGDLRLGGSGSGGLQRHRSRTGARKPCSFSCVALVGLHGGSGHTWCSTPY